jgi:methylated-DNA-protein-cysteine methyltransferase related protein
MSVAAPAASRYERIYQVVRRIPRGRVATYGQVAQLAGLPGQARQVGYALHALPRGARVPWQRVVNSYGNISLRSASDDDRLQRLLLYDEGIRFTRSGQVDLGRYRWRPRGPKG